MNIIETPWDSKTFGFPTYELKNLDSEVISQLKNIKGHITIKVDPLISKEELALNGFYYCDTLLTPYCKKEEFVNFENENVTIKTDSDFDSYANICLNNTFQHGRYHRDFNIDNKLADKRYYSWLEQLYNESRVLTLMYKDDVAGFFGYKENNILLHAISDKYRGKGLAKYFWSEACNFLFSKGEKDLKSSISAANIPVLNLYNSLGFKIVSATDVYHKFNL